MLSRCLNLDFYPAWNKQYQWAREKARFKDYIHKPDFTGPAKTHGFQRNELMAKNADSAIILWDGQSKGTYNMIQLAERYKLQLYVHGVIII